MMYMMHTLDPSLTPGIFTSGTLAEAAVLVSWWKALLIVPPMVGWAWLVSTVLDKHAARFSLGRDKWNTAHLLLGLLALVAALAIPVEAWWSFAVGYVAMLAILAADVGVFVAVVNRDERVPEAARLRLNLKDVLERRRAKRSKAKQAAVKLQIIGPDKQAVPTPEKDTPEYEVRATAEEALTDALDARAARIDIVASQREGASGVSAVIDGVRQKAVQLGTQQAISMIDFWKACSGLDVKDRRRKQSAMFKIVRSEIDTKLKAVTSGAQGGVQLSLIVDPEDAVRISIDKLGLLPQQLETLRGMEHTGGIVLLTAPAQQGRTTTFYSVLGLHDAYTSSIQTLEYEIETRLEGVRHDEFDPTADAEFSTTVRSILRRDPDVVGVAELPDAETAKEAARVEAERTRVYISMRTEGSVPALSAWMKAVGDAQEATDPLSGVVSQRLIRTLCENCRIAYQPPAELLKKLQLPADKVKQLYKKGGQVMIKDKPETCPVCQGTGYYGQRGVFEVLPIGPEEREALREQNWNQLRAEWRKKNGIMLGQAAMRLAIEGVTSIEEISRVTAPPQEKKKQQAAAGDAKTAPAAG